MSEKLPFHVGTPAAEFPLDEATVSRLLREQHPDVGHLPLRAVEAGWDNAMFRLGDHLAVRLPRRTQIAGLILHEQRWLPAIAPSLVLPVPAPCRIGEPTTDYPCAWSVVPWLQGEPADQAPPHHSQAAILGDFLRSLHVPAPADAPANPVRGVSLSLRVPLIEARMQRLYHRSSLVTPPIRDLWQRAVAAPQDAASTWIHGDLHPRNVLVENGRISGIVDWGDMAAGDPATDLAAVHMLFDHAQSRAIAFERYGHLTQATLLRAMGWAINFALILLDTGLTDNPRNAAIGERTLRNLTQSA